MKKIKKPKNVCIVDECGVYSTNEYPIQVCGTLLDVKEAKRLLKWLESAVVYMENKKAKGSK